MELILEILSYIVWVLLAITILVFVHEMGHFLAAKFFKMRVEKFSIGFPPKIFGKTIGETEYVLGATPLGGYVKISGMVDESMDTEYLQSEPEDWEFRSKPVWQRIVVITAGVIFNVILAAIIFSGLNYIYGDAYIPAENVENVYVRPGSLAHEMGLRTGDRIVAVNGELIKEFNDVEDVDRLLADEMTITVDRQGQELVFEGPEDIMTQWSQRAGLGIFYEPSIISQIAENSSAEEAGMQSYDRVTSINGQEVHFWHEMTAVLQEQEGDSLAITWHRPDSLLAAGSDQTVGSGSQIGQVAGFGVFEARVPLNRDEESGLIVLGVYAPDREILIQEYGVVQEDLSLVQAVGAGVTETWVNSKVIVTSLKRIFTGREDLRENLGGPVMVAKVTKQAVDAGWFFFWRIVAILSITLAIMNILPIPALDGGHLMFLIYEGITRREPSLKVRMWLQQIGMILLLVFMTFLVFNDILRL